MTTRLECWLEIDPTYRRVLHTERNNGTHFVQVDEAINRWDQYDMRPNLCQTIQRPQFLRQNIWFATEHAIGFSFKTIKLKINRWAQLT